MTDLCRKNLAKILVDYSTAVQSGQWVVIKGSVVALPLINDLVEMVLMAGGNPTVQIQSGEIEETGFLFSDNEQLKWISPISEMIYTRADVLIDVWASENLRSLSSIDPQKQRIRSLAAKDVFTTFLNRLSSGDMMWVGTQYPCQAYAQEADMSLRDFERFVYGATFADQDDPVARWKEIKNSQQQLVDWLNGKNRFEVKGPHADLSLSCEGRTFINDAGEKNMPGGEIFTSPVEDSVNGWIEFTYPAIESGREVDGIRLEFDQGKVVKASAQKNEAFLLEMLDSDEGARYLGEFAIGTNYGIQRFTKSILYDEKLGGTIHLALGSSLPLTGGKNQSSIHWDMICDMRTQSQIVADGEVFYKNGQFQI